MGLAGSRSVLNLNGFPENRQSDPRWILDGCDGDSWRTDCRWKYRNRVVVEYIVHGAGSRSRGEDLGIRPWFEVSPHFQVKALHYTPHPCLGRGLLLQDLFRLLEFFFGG